MASTQYGRNKMFDTKYWAEKIVGYFKSKRDKDPKVARSQMLMKS